MQYRHHIRQIIKMEYKKLTKPLVVALDLDETIHDVIEVYENAFNLTRQHLGMEPLSKQQIDLLHKDGYKRTSETYNIVFGERATEALKYYYNTLHMNYIPEDYVFPGAKEMLAGIKSRGVHLIAVTNSDQHIAKKILRDIKLFDFFDSVTGVKPDRVLKPDPELLRIGLKKIGQEPGKHVWFMGDSATDTQCAKITGCTAIRYYHQHKQKPEDLNADAFFTCHFEFLAAIEYFYSEDA
jgi:phosphoglycolate phosphatase